MPQNRVTDLTSKFTRDWARGFKDTAILRFFKHAPYLNVFFPFNNWIVDSYICVTRPLKIHHAFEQPFSQTSGMKEALFPEF